MDIEKKRIYKEESQMKLVIYTANCAGNAKNCSYPNRMEISNEEELVEAGSRVW